MVKGTYDHAIGTVTDLLDELVAGVQVERGSGDLEGGWRLLFCS
jgi:hypothetical protein